MRQTAKLGTRQYTGVQMEKERLCILWSESLTDRHAPLLTLKFFASFVELYYNAFPNPHTRVWLQMPSLDSAPGAPLVGQVAESSC